MMQSPASLSLHSVSKHFGSFRAVDGIDLDVGQNEFLSLLGPSGSGKTTLLRIIAGLELPSTGSVIVGGQDVTRRPPYRRRIGMVFQNFLLFPHKTVAENIIFPLRMQRLSRVDCTERLKWAVGLLRLEGLESRYPAQLSGGQQQRVSLARGLISRPALLLLDEPLANLDRELRAEMEVEIRRYQKELGIPFVYVTHNQEEALTMSDRIAVMRHGIFEQIAPRTEVYEKPATAFVAAFVGQSNHLDGIMSSASSGRAAFDWKGHRLTGPCKAVVKSGERIRLSIKYEDIKVSPDTGTPGSRDGVNRLRGRLRDIIFKGQTANLLVQLPDGSEIIASASPRGMAVNVGDAVLAEWPETAGMCFSHGR